MVEPIVWIEGPGADDLLGTARQLMACVAGLEAAQGRGEPLELSVLLTGDAEIRELNARWRGIDQPTDVLSFPMDGGPVLGDVAISVEMAAARVAPGEWALEDELLFLLIHGVLHLLGLDHQEEDQTARMEAEEQALWTAMGRVGTLRDL